MAMAIAPGCSDREASAHGGYCITAAKSGPVAVLSVVFWGHVTQISK